MGQLAASSQQQSHVASGLAVASHEAQQEANKLRSNVGAMDLEIDDLRRQLAAQSSSGPALSTAADVFSEGSQLIIAAKASVDDVCTIIHATPALKSHEKMKEPVAKIMAIYEQLQAHSEKMVAVTASPAMKLAHAEISRQEAVSQLARKEAQISGGSDTARSNLSHTSSAQLTARSSEHSALQSASKEASSILEQEKAKLQEIIAEEESLAQLAATGSKVEKQQAEQKRKALEEKKDEASQKVEKQQAVRARAATQLAETLLSEPVEGLPPPILGSQKARLQELLAKERGMRDQLNSFSISESEKIAIISELEGVEVAKAEATEALGRTVATHQAESLLTEAVATSTPVLDREKERLTAILEQERALHAQLEAASDAERLKLQGEFDSLQAAKVETSQRLGQQLYEIQAEQALGGEIGRAHV
jgi:hypothetical protein